MKSFFFFVLFTCVSSCAQAQRNVVLIIADDLSSDYFGFYENHVDTVDVPNIRSLLTKGVRFKKFISNPVCSATRTTILTGRFGFRTGVGGIVGGTGGSNQIDTAEVSIPKLLRIYNPSIQKADIGKWHLNQPMPNYNLQAPLSLGYDRFEGPFIGQLPSYTNWTKYINGVSSTVTNYATSENVDNAVSWIKSVNSSNPFFLWLAFNAPHEPLHLPPSGLHSYTALSGTPANINAQPKEYFKAMIQALDHEIGRLFDSLQVLNRMDSTDIIFIGDNGNTPRTAQISDTSRAKGTIYEYGVHVPLIISGPSIVNPNRSNDSLVNSVDLFSTILELMGDKNWALLIPVLKPVDTKSIVPILKNTANGIRPWAFCENFKLISDSSDGKAMRTNNYKLLRFDYGAEQFYNLATDPLETNNLLNTTMSSVDISAYYYLCNEMTALTGSGNFCNTSVGVQTIEPRTNFLSAYPNPFTNSIRLNSKFQNKEVALMNSLGDVIYKGHSIESQNFSKIKKGIYYLRIFDFGDQRIKLIKE